MLSGRDVFRYHIPASLHLKEVFSVRRSVERATVCMVAFAALASISSDEDSHCYHLFFQAACEAYIAPGYSPACMFAAERTTSVTQ